MDESSSSVSAVLWDFGGVLTTSPFGAFAEYEREHGLPAGFLRRLNASNPDTNAWAAFERGEVTVDEFAALFEEEAAAAGGRVDALAVLDRLGGQLRPAMVEALRRCHARLKTALLTNNFTLAGGREDALGYGPVLSMFDVVVESSAARCRKPDPRFYEMACDLLAVEPVDAVFLDDLGINLKPARLMGMRTIKVEDPDLAIRELEAVVGFPLAGEGGGAVPRTAAKPDPLSSGPPHRRAHERAGRPAPVRAWHGSPWPATPTPPC